MLLCWHAKLELQRHTSYTKADLAYLVAVITNYHSIIDLLVNVFIYYTCTYFLLLRVSDSFSLLGASKLSSIGDRFDKYTCLIQSIYLIAGTIHTVPVHILIAYQVSHTVQLTWKGTCGTHLI